MQSHWCAGNIQIIVSTHFSSLRIDGQVKNDSAPLTPTPLEPHTETVFLHDNTSLLNESTLRSVYNSDWFVYLDIVLVGILAISAMLANLGLLSLARRTKPALWVTGSSLSNNCVSVNLAPPSTGQTREENTNQTWRLFCCSPPRRTKNPQPVEYASQCFVGFTGQNPIQRYPSSISLCRSSYGNQTNAGTGNCGTVMTASHRHRSTRSRRHRRYLRGLFGLSVSNLTVSFSLTALLISLIVERTSSLHSSYWLTVVSVINIGLADLAQAVEIGAVLWIALERTFGIHWFKEGRLSNSRKTSTAFTRHSFAGTSSYTPGGPRLAGYRHSCDRTSYTNWMLTFRRSIRTEKSGVGRAQLDERKSGGGPDKGLCCSSWSMKCKRNPVYMNNSFLCKWLVRRSKCFIRLILSFTPLTLSLLAIIVSTFTLVSGSISLGHTPPFRSATAVVVANEPNGQAVTNTNQIVTIRHGLDPTNFLVYYTDSIAAALVIGQFLLPLTILVTTNLLIYRKVASRDKRLFTRQSSDTSKSSFLSNTSDYSLVVNPQVSRNKPNNYIQPLNTGVPLLRVLESSNQDLHNEVAEDPSVPTHPQSNEQPRCEQDKNMLAVPGSRPEGDSAKLRLVQRQRSASVIELESSANDTRLSSSLNKTATDLDLRRMLLSTPQQRRKSSSDIFTSLFHQRSQEATSFAAHGTRGTGGEEPMLLQMLRRQHRRTLRILIILLLVFVACHGPRAFVLLLGWFNSEQVCQNVFQAYFWLQYTTWWAYSSAVLDTIVYGFWGNRAYRVQLRHLYARCTTASRRPSVPGLC